MLITVPIIVFCSTLFARIINTSCHSLGRWCTLCWVAGEMIVEDPLLIPYIQGEELLVKIGAVSLLVLIVTGMIKIWKKRGRNERLLIITSHKKAILNNIE